MSTIFTRIINGEIPARFVWTDELCVAFLDVRPLAPGHVLVVPRLEIDQWTDLPTDVATHLMSVAQHIGIAQKELLAPERIGLMIAGFEVPHVHIHVVPINTMRSLDFANADPNPDQDELDRLHQQLGAALQHDPS